MDQRREPTFTGPLGLSSAFSINPTDLDRLSAATPASSINPINAPSPPSPLSPSSPPSPPNHPTPRPHTLRQVLFLAFHVLITVELHPSIGWFERIHHILPLITIAPCQLRSMNPLIQSIQKRSQTSSPRNGIQLRHSKALIRQQ